MERWVKGTLLSPAVQREILACFVHRLTGDHKPAWSNKIWKDGMTYPLQFRDDRDWLENTVFCVNPDGR